MYKQQLLQETIAILSGEIYQQVYDIVGNDSFATAGVIISLAEQFEADYQRDISRDYLTSPCIDEGTYVVEPSDIDISNL